MDWMDCMEKRHYEWENLKGETVQASQGELVLWQEKELAKLLFDFKVEDIKELENRTIKEILSVFLENNIFERFLNIILKGQFSDDVPEMPFSVQEAVIKDFLSFNARLIGSLRGFWSGIGLASLSSEPKIE